MQSTLEDTPTAIAVRIWFLTSMFLGAAAFLLSFIAAAGAVPLSLVVPAVSLIAGLPALFVLIPIVRWLQSLDTTTEHKKMLLHVICVFLAALYGAAGILYFADLPQKQLYMFAGLATAVLCLFSQLALSLCHKLVNRYFTDTSKSPLLTINADIRNSDSHSEQLSAAHLSDNRIDAAADRDIPPATSSEVPGNAYGHAPSTAHTPSSPTHTLTQHKMETHYTPSANLSNSSASQSSRYLIKGLITAGLILFMLIPVAFIMNLISEREERQKAVAAEVSERWASAQTLTGPYLHVPYHKTTTSSDGKATTTEDFITLLPENLNVGGTLEHEMRKRSIYNVLLYRAAVKTTGGFLLNLPENVKSEDVIWNDVRICTGITDFKGIEERLSVNLNGTEIELSPGLPETNVANAGLSAPAKLSAANVGQTLPFASILNIRGSEKLHFIPLAGNSSFTVQSTWTSPSFDGSSLPRTRSVADSGFTATWNFNKANLPFGTTINGQRMELDKLAFGVTMVQPADQYAKTERTAKYAILIIGLTFSLFFIVEIMQKKPVHPVQYVLVGMALVIFYTLLLSFSEFIIFDKAYAAAAIATISLITLYAKAHFKSWKSAALFGGVLLLLYSFIFILIRLEDTALLVGSIGLFIILALAMYASRKVNWYGAPASPAHA